MSCAHLALGKSISPLLIAGVVIMLSAIIAMNYYRYTRASGSVRRLGMYIPTLRTAVYRFRMAVHLL